MGKKSIIQDIMENNMNGTFYYSLPNWQCQEKKNNGNNEKQTIM